MTKEEMKAALQDELSQFKNDMASFATSEDMQNKLNDLETRMKELDLTEGLKELTEAVEKQGIDLQKIQGDQPAEKLDIVTELTNKLSDIKSIAKGERPGKSIELKALTLRANVTDTEQAFELPDIGQLANRKLNAYDVFPKLRVTTKNDGGNIRYYDWDAATAVRAAAMVAEGAAFPESTAKWVTKVLPLEKIGDTLPVTEEFFEDSSLFAAELGMFLETNVKIKEDSEIILGTGTSPSLAGLVTVCPVYTAAASGITDASIYDLVVKLNDAIMGPGGGKYVTDIAIMNRADISKYKLKKDANNNYVMPPFVSESGKVIDGVTVIEDNAVVANTMYVGDRRFGRIYEKTGYDITRGFVGDQFAEDEMTLKIRKRMLFLVREADKSGFLQVEDIDAALTTLATAP